MDHAHDVVDAVVVDGETGIAALHKERGRLLHGGGVGDGHQIHTGSEDLGHFQIVELDGVADQIALMLVQAAFILCLIHHAHQLLLGDAVALSGAEHLGEQPLPLREQEVGRGQDDDQQAKQRGGDHGPALRILLGQALGGDLAEDQDDDGQDNGGDSGTADVVDQLDEQHRADGGGHVVDDVVADEDGGQQAVIVLRQLQRAGGPAVAVVRFVLQTDAVERGKGGLGCGKIPGHGHQGHQGDEHCDTGTVHKGRINSTFMKKDFCAHRVQRARLVIHYIIAAHKKQINFPNL